MVLSRHLIADYAVTLGGYESGFVTFAKYEINTKVEINFAKFSIIYFAEFQKKISQSYSIPHKEEDSTRNYQFI
jgi:hypothetical protein